MATEPAPAPSAHELWTEEGIVTLSHYEVDNILVALCLRYSEAGQMRPSLAKMLRMWTDVFDNPGKKWSISRQMVVMTLQQIGEFADSIQAQAPTSFRIYVNLFNKLNVRSGVPPPQKLPTTTHPVVEKKGRKRNA